MEGGFDDSPIRLNEFLRTAEVWNEEQIQKRGEGLAKKAAKIWQAPHHSDEILAKYRIKEKETGIYTAESYEYLKNEIFGLYQLLQKRILNLDSSVREEFKKFYIAFKSTTNFVDIVAQKSRLILYLNMEYLTL